MSKRKQRSTAIRKRIEKKARETAKAARKAAKAAGGGDDGVLVVMSLGRAQAAACRDAITALEERLAGESLRGWTPADLDGDFGLLWLRDLLTEALDGAAEGSSEDAGDDDGELVIELLEQGKMPLLDRLGALEMAASGLRLEWEEAGFDPLVRALRDAEELGDEGGEEG